MKIKSTQLFNIDGGKLNNIICGDIDENENDKEETITYNEGVHKHNI